MIIIKRLIIKLLSILISISVLFLSSLTALADTTVDIRPLTIDYFKENVFNYDTTNQSLKTLPSDDYLTFVSMTHNNTNKTNVRCYFVPQSKRKIVYLGQNVGTNLSVTDDTLYLFYNGSSNNFYLSFTGSYYELLKSSTGTVSDLSINPVQADKNYNTIPICNTHHYGSNPDYIYINNSNIINSILSLPGFSPIDKLLTSTTYAANCDGLFSMITQIITGYNGAIYDSTLEQIIEKNGKSCNDSIIDSYKYRIYYSLNNDLRYVFLNNAYEPKYIKDKIDGSNSDLAYKYKFTYQKSSDCIVYFPTFQMYLTYDDWYSFQPKDNDFKWFWEEQTDNKSFTLYSDWSYENGNYIGSRVALSWEQTNQLGENADFTSLSQFITDKDKLLNNGWIDGRPSDTSYPYCIEVDYNGNPGLFIYSNSKPTISKIDIQSDTYKKFNIYMVGMYGYVYNSFNDVYINYDFTIKDGQKNFVQQYLFKYFSYQLHCLDNDLNLTLYENYKGTDSDYKGTRVFFNWDITQDKRFGISDEQMQKLEENCKEDIGGFRDENGNNHGGNLNNYTDEDKNKFNESGTNSSNTTDNSFDFTFDGIINYCDEFFRFIESVFGLFPSFIWVLVGASIAVLIALRVIGR